MKIKTFQLFSKKDNGSVFAFGYNEQGQLGLGDPIDRPTPTKIPNLDNVKQSLAGNFFSLVLLSNNFTFMNESQIFV